MYYNKIPGGEYIYLLLYVDGMLIASKNRSVIDKLKKDLSSEFDMKDLGEAKKVLSMEIERDRRSGKVSLTQKGVFAEGTSEVQHQRRHEICKYTIGFSFQVKNHYVSYYYWRT